MKSHFLAFKINFNLYLDFLKLKYSLYIDISSKLILIFVIFL